MVLYLVLLYAVVGNEHEADVNKRFMKLFQYSSICIAASIDSWEIQNRKFHRKPRVLK